MASTLKNVATVFVALAIMNTVARPVVFAGTWRDVTYSHCLQLAQTNFDIESTRMSSLLQSMWLNVRGAVSNEFGLGSVRVEVASATSAMVVAGQNVKEYKLQMVGDAQNSVLLMLNTRTNVIEHEYVRDERCFVRRGVPQGGLRKRRNGKPVRRRGMSVTQEEVWRATTSSSPCLSRNGSVDGSFGDNLLNGSHVMDYQLVPINGTSANVTISLAVGSLTLRLERPSGGHVDAFYEDGLPVFADDIYLKKLDALETNMYCHFSGSSAGTVGTVRRLIGAARLLGGVITNRVKQAFARRRV